MTCNAYKVPLAWYQRPFALAEKQAWWWRLPLLVWFAYLFTRYVGDGQYGMDRSANIINAFNLGIHELGHILFVPLGTFMSILGGSLFQCLFPLMWLATCLWKKWYFGACLCLCWFGFNLFDVATYAADARSRLLPLVSLNSDYDSAHDWYQILSRLDKLSYDTVIAQWLRIFGSIAVVLGLLAGLLLVGRMFTAWLNRLSKGAH